MAGTRLSPTTARARLTALRGPDYTVRDHLVHHGALSGPDYTERLSDSDVSALLAAIEATPLASGEEFGRMTDKDWSDFAAVLVELKRIRDTGRMPHPLAQATDAALERVRDGLDGIPT